MKKIVFATLLCIAAMSANAQVITSKTVNNVYESAIQKPKSNFVYNAMRTGKEIVTMYIYRKIHHGNNVETLKPHRKYDYTYAPDGTVTSRTTYRWTDSKSAWTCIGRYDYTLTGDEYTTAFSRYNPATESFDQPVDMTIIVAPQPNLLAKH